MPITQSLLALGPLGALLLCGLVPSQLANRHVSRFRQLVTWITGIQCVGAIAMLLGLLPHLLAGGGGRTVALGFGIGLYLDGVSLLMLSLVSFVGCVVSRYSVRYLDGDPNQGSFFRWVALTVGAVSLVVSTGNLLVLLAAWVLTSFGLHHLLVHYPQREAAQRAAWTKFAISRLGDFMLVAAIVLIYQQFGTLELSAIFASLQSGTETDAGSMAWIAWLVVLGAATKSAQFPLHSWLPDTLETPTPVSALMHAGIVNAGGYLVIRLSPLVVQAPAALGSLAIIGAVTVCYAGIVMMTQTSIKKTLAYSTIAQMGFMMLQCGLGAFSAAMLHILAHSLYKAYAFLNSGNVLAEADGRRRPSKGAVHKLNSTEVASGFALAFAAVFVSSLLLHVDLAGKSGGLALGFILTLALATWLWDVLRLESVRATFVGLFVVACLATLYMSGYSLVDQVVGGSVVAMESTLVHALAATVMVTVFSVLLGLRYVASHPRGREFLAPLYVHATNGFYLEAYTRRLLAVRS